VSRADLTGKRTIKGYRRRTPKEGQKANLNTIRKEQKNLHKGAQGNLGVQEGTTLELSRGAKTRKLPKPRGAGDVKGAGAREGVARKIEEVDGHSSGDAVLKEREEGNRGLVKQMCIVYQKKVIAKREESKTFENTRSGKTQFQGGKGAPREQIRSWSKKERGKEGGEAPGNCIRKPKKAGSQ